MKRIFRIKAFGGGRVLLAAGLLAAFVASFAGNVNIGSYFSVPTAHADTETHVFKFYLDPALVPDMAFAQNVLPKYVADMNYVLAKNTRRQFSFDPQTGIILSPTVPPNGTAGVLPTSGYGVWAYASAITNGYPISFGGSASFDSNGNGALINLRWTKLYDPDVLVGNTPEMADYWTQIDHMLHEFGHVTGAAIGEYYGLYTIHDTTGVAPLLDISADNLNDSFWANKQDFFTDSMLLNIYGRARLGNPTSRQALLDTAKYSNLTAAVMNGFYRNASPLPPLPDLQHIVVRVVDSSTGAPLPGANVKMWNVQGFNPYTNQQLADTVTDANGEVTVSWGINSYYDNFDYLKLFKAYSDGYSAKAKYFSVWDANIIKMINNSDQVVITIPLDTDTVAPTASITSPTNGSFVTGASTITATASDNIGVSKVELYKDGTLMSTSTSAPYNFVWDTTIEPSGVHTLQVKAYDVVGNVGTSPLVSVTVDNTSPAVSITAPANGAQLSGNVTVSANASDNIGITKVEFYRDSNILLGTDTTSPYSVSWNTAVETVGSHTFFAKAYDAAGNTTNSATRSVTIKDQISPSTSITSPANNALVNRQTVVTIAGAASDNVAVTKVEFYVNGSLKCTDTTSAYSCNWTVPSSKNVVYSLQTKAYDAAGHITASSIVSVKSK